MIWYVELNSVIKKGDQNEPEMKWVLGVKSCSEHMSQMTMPPTTTSEENLLSSTSETLPDMRLNNKIARNQPIVIRLVFVIIGLKGDGIYNGALILSNTVINFYYVN